MNSRGAVSESQRIQSNQNRSQEEAAARHPSLLVRGPPGLQGLDLEPELARPAFFTGTQRLSVTQLCTQLTKFAAPIQSRGVQQMGPSA